MAKLRETGILTNKVYLNIEKNDGTVDTISLSTEQSLADYGELEVVSVGEPVYQEEPSVAADEGKRGRRRPSSAKQEEDDGRKVGVTDVMLRGNS